MSKPQRDKSILDNVDPEKREFIGKLIGTGTFIAPLVASFAMQNLVAADAQAANSSKT